MVGVFITCFLCVSLRHSLMSSWFNSAGDVHEHLKISPETLAISDMCFLLFYALGNFTLGILGDKYSQKLVLCLSSSIAACIYGLVIPT